MSHLFFSLISRLFPCSIFTSRPLSTVYLAFTRDKEIEILGISQLYLYDKHRCCNNMPAPHKVHTYTQHRAILNFQSTGSPDHSQSRSLGMNPDTYMDLPLVTTLPGPLGTISGSTGCQHGTQGKQMLEDYMYPYGAGMQVKVRSCLARGSRCCEKRR